MTDSLTILVIDDEPQIRRLIRNALAAEPIQFDPGAEAQAMYARVIDAETGRKGIDLAAAEGPALVILDLALPDINGMEVCQEIRSWSSAAILVLSARNTDYEKARLLDAGADDYVTKPFSMVELMARVRAQVRRTRRLASDEHASRFVATFGDIVVDQQRRRVERGGKPIHLTPTEWSLLRTLVARPYQTLTHRQLFSAVWGSNVGDAQQYLRVYVGHLRRKIEHDPVRPRFIQTESGVGYRFEPDGVAA